MPWWWMKRAPRTPRKLREPIERHLKIDLSEAHSVAHEIKPVQRVNLQRVLDRWADESTPPAQAVGFSSTGYFADDGLVKYLITDELIQSPVERTQLPSSLDETLDCLLRGLYLLRREGSPVVLALRPPRFSSELPILEVIAATREVARTTLASLLEEAQRSSVYKGKALSIEQHGNWNEGVTIRFHEIRATKREAIVLPEELIRVVERNVFGMLQHRDRLLAASRSLRRGLLFHGPPGTGKTMMIRYLIQACKDHTVIMLVGSHQGLVREACQIARMLAPSIVVLEDVDLVAEDREQNRSPSILHDLMNEMDGLGSRSEVSFLLTTNRPAVLELALSARPGRIDQAIEFPLPDEACRRRLFDVYGRGLDLSFIDLQRWVSQTDGVSPAFIEELLRKATLMAAERGESTTPMRLTDADIQEAIRELIYFGGELTEKLLGYCSGRLGFQSSSPR
jgi:SpoVK/Ycf46/Vps4 family AAA+-type ATPase